MFADYNTLTPYAKMLDVRPCCDKIGCAKKNSCNNFLRKNLTVSLPCQKFNFHSNLHLPLCDTIPGDIFALKQQQLTSTAAQKLSGTNLCPPVGDCRGDNS